MCEADGESDEEPEDHFILVLVAYLVCCPLGAVAMYYSEQTRKHNYKNERDLAAEASRYAFIFAIAAILVKSRESGSCR
nr:PREDICTED: synapse differentiation-inducing gene protein 1-like [Equus przewalskii]